MPWQSLLIAAVAVFIATESWLAKAKEANSNQYILDMNADYKDEFSNHLQPVDKSLFNRPKAAGPSSPTNYPPSPQNDSSFQASGPQPTPVKELSSRRTTEGVRLIKEAGTFTVPVRINDVLELHFTVDSGASDVTIPYDVVMTLVRTGTIKETDFIGEQTYVLADGSRVRSKTFRIRQLTVGNRTIENVKGSIADVKGSLLLGQSFLSRFNRVSFDYSQGLLFLE